MTFVVNSYSGKWFMLLSNINQFRYKTDCDKNLESDKLVSVWQFMVLGNREYMGVYLNVL